MTLYRKATGTILSNGLPVSSVDVYFWNAGGVSALDLYSDSGGVTPESNPLSTDSSGRYSCYFDVIANATFRIYLEKPGYDFTNENLDNDGISLPGAGSDEWSTYPATEDVDMAGYDITDLEQDITDNHIATIDDADAADNDYAKFTANGLEGRSYAEVLGDLTGANLDVGAFDVRGQTLTADVAIGTAPLVITSTTVVANLNVDQVDGKDSTDILLVTNNLSDVGTAATAFANIKQAATDAATGVVELATDAETLTGTATDRVTTPANITAKLATPGAIGGGTPAAGAFTTISASGLITATGGQIAFPATAVPSADANTIDDYEEGAWTIGISFGGGTTDITYNASYVTGYYTKIGNIAYISGHLVLTSNGTDVGDAKITGLPFTSSPVAATAITTNMEGVTFANQFVGFLAENTNFIGLFEVTEGGTITNLTNADVGDAAQFKIGGAYRAQ